MQCGSMLAEACSIVQNRSGAPSTFCKQRAAPHAITICWQHSKLGAACCCRFTLSVSKLFTRTLEVVFIELGGITLFYTSLILTGNVIILALFGWLGAWYGLWPIVVMTFVGEYGALLARVCTPSPCTKTCNLHALDSVGPETVLPRRRASVQSMTSCWVPNSEAFAIWVHACGKCAIHGLTIDTCIQPASLLLRCLDSKVVCADLQRCSKFDRESARQRDIPGASPGQGFPAQPAWQWQRPRPWRPSGVLQGACHTFS